MTRWCDTPQARAILATFADEPCPTRYKDGAMIFTSTLDDRRVSELREIRRLSGEYFPTVEEVVREAEVGRCARFAPAALSSFGSSRFASRRPSAASIPNAREG